jgi:hypothetical protein
MPLSRALGCVAALLCISAPPILAAPQVETPETTTPAPDPSTTSAEEPMTTLDPAVVDVPPNARRARWYGRGAIGMAYRWGFDESMMGAALDAELGAQNQRLAGGVRLHLEAGRMFAGLPFQVVTFGPMMWVNVAPRFRFGVGIDAGALVISRRTIPGRSMWTVMIGGHIGGSVDLFKLGATGALQLDTTLGAYALTLAPGPASIVTTLGLGYRP